MTTAPAASGLSPASAHQPGPSGTARLVSAVGLAVTAVSLWGSARSLPLWAVVVAAAALLSWAALTAMPERAPAPLRWITLGVMALGGAASSAATSGLALVPMVVAVVTAFGATAAPLAAGIVVTAAALVCTAIPALLEASPLRLLLSLAALGASVMLGLARRQTRLAQERERRTALELVEAHRALAASAARDERARIARDLHDVLAHTLGGLVLQLDAVEALAEAGRAEDAATRARTARRLAADGLRDARVAVGVLDGTRSLDLADLADQVRRLVATERDLGVDVEAEVDELEGPAAPALVDAFRGAAAEALTNARKHASGRPVRLTMTARDGVLSLRVSNPLGAASALSASGSGRGLDGMRQRFSALPGGEAHAGTADGSFVVRAGAVIG
ncbi:histidine kinase [Microbacterium sp.]|uniref:sensor histidine kinase n=1 Tax=Microbacterium sp. TaxID=51671 RepID=UPI003340DC64